MPSNLVLVGSFADHAGFDGVMLGRAGAGFHFEFTHCRMHPVQSQPTSEDLIVLYLPEQTDWERRCAAMADAGFVTVPSFNPYWDLHGRTFIDEDGYRTVLQHAAWSNVEEESATTK